jgi:hypothetical protein
MENLSLISEFQEGSGQGSHYRFHPRVWAHDGCIIDLGCSTWDWSKCFAGRKRIVGCDPSEETVPYWAEFYRGFVGSFCGKVRYHNGNQNRITGLAGGESEADIITLKQLVRRFDLRSISLLKLNVEGMEYDLLIHLQEPVADQIVVSFHDYSYPGLSNPSNPRATDAVLDYLSEWYDWCPTLKERGWYVLLRKPEYGRAET